MGISPQLIWSLDYLTLQDRFLDEIVKNNPDSAVREYAQEVLLRSGGENPEA